MIIDDLFNLIADRDKQDNPFETCEGDDLYNEFSEKYITPLIKSSDEAVKAKGLTLENDLVTMQAYERKVAFEIGYRTALDLILEGR